MVLHWDLQNVESEVSSSVKDPFLALFNVYCIKMLENVIKHMECGHEEFETGEPVGKFNKKLFILS